MALPCQVSKEPPEGAEAAALGGDAEGLAVFLAVAVQPPLEGFEVWAGDGFGFCQVAVLRPL